MMQCMACRLNITSCNCSILRVFGQTEVSVVLHLKVFPQRIQPFATGRKRPGLVPDATNTGSRNVSDIFHEALLSWYHGFKIKRCFVCFLFLLTELNHMQSHAYIFNRNLCRTVSNSRHVANRPVLGFANGQSREMIWQLDWFLLVLFGSLG